MAVRLNPGNSSVEYTLAVPKTMKSVSAKEVPTVFCAERFRLVSEQLQVTCIELGQEEAEDAP